MKTHGLVVEKSIEEALGSAHGIAPFQCHMFVHEECLSYLAWNNFGELIVVDPRKDDVELYLNSIRSLEKVLPLAIIDTHTHADHLSGAFDLAQALKAPYFASHLSPSKRLSFRVSGLCALSSRAAPIRFLPTPGHTEDGMCVEWGPLVFTGDTLIYGDVGRDDLPGGNASQHFESIELLKRELTNSSLILPGHDNKGGRASTWQTQLEINGSLSQARDQFIRECEAFVVPAPKLFKESLVENFK